MDAPDYNHKTWHCNACEGDFDVEVGSYNLAAGDWPECPHCGSGSTELL